MTTAPWDGYQKCQGVGQYRCVTSGAVVLRQKPPTPCPSYSSHSSPLLWFVVSLGLSWQLWLARQLVIDSPLPWQKPQPNLTSGRVAQGFAALLVRIGSPACSPKPRGKSLGCKSGRKRSPFPRFPIIKKRASRPKKGHKESSNSLSQLLSISFSWICSVLYWLGYFFLL